MSMFALPILLVAVLAVHTFNVAALPQVLVYTKTAGFRHESIPIAVQTITSLGNGSLTLPSSAIDPSVSALRWSTVNTEDETQFHNLTFLSQFDAIGFVSTTDQDPPLTGTVLDDQGLRNLARYIEQGGGYFGIHSASATLFGAPFYGRLVGAYFDYHPQIQNVSVKPVDASHPSTSRWPADGLRIYEEVYNFRSDPRNLPSPARVLVTNASTYSDPGVNPQGFRNGTNGPSPHPLAWWRQGGLLDSNSSTDASVSGVGGADIQASGGPGRAWYTSLGHDISTWQLDLFRGHVAGGIGWVLQSSTARSAQGGSSNGSSGTPSQDSTPASSSAHSLHPAHLHLPAMAVAAPVVTLVGLSVLVA
ncbi:ThuA domain-containing protein [Pseudozyma hubeiensis]|nr:ThuA domain-containing protein [Pseudozyma hubeiensis]